MQIVCHVKKQNQNMINLDPAREENYLTDLEVNYVAFWG
jgi:hypothetical protein